MATETLKAFADVARGFEAGIDSILELLIARGKELEVELVINELFDLPIREWSSVRDGTRHPVYSTESFPGINVYVKKRTLAIETSYSDDIEFEGPRVDRFYRELQQRHNAQ